MVCKLRIVSFLIFVLMGCQVSSSSLNESGENYKQTNSYTSLQEIYKNLYQGMNRDDVISLLGAPDYSPTEGQYYYSSNETEFSEQQGRAVPVGLIVDYRDSDHALTEQLQQFWLGPIGE